VQILAPGVEHAEETDFRTQMFGIGGDGEQGLSGGAEENLVDGLLVLQGDGGDGLGQSEDHVEIGGGQQLGLSLLEPLETGLSLALGTVPVTAGTIARMGVLAVAAEFDDTAQLRCAAGLDRLHDTAMMQG